MSAKEIEKNVINFLNNIRRNVSRDHSVDRKKYAEVKFSKH